MSYTCVWHTEWNCPAHVTTQLFKILYFESYFTIQWAAIRRDRLWMRIATVKMTVECVDMDMIRSTDCWYVLLSNRLPMLTGYKVKSTPHTRTPNHTRYDWEWKFPKKYTRMWVIHSMQQMIAISAFTFALRRNFTIRFKVQWFVCCHLYWFHLWMGRQKWPNSTEHIIHSHLLINFSESFSAPFTPEKYLYNI